MEFDLELLLEGFALGFDALILGFLYKSYESCSAYIEALKEAQPFEIDRLQEVAVAEQPKSFWTRYLPFRSKKVETGGPSAGCQYVVLRGKVEPLDKNRLLRSLDNQSTGVIHRITTKEVAAVRNGSRFWVNEQRVVKSVQHEVPWGLKPQDAGNTKQTLVQVMDGLGADRIDLPVIRDEFTPAPFSLSSWLGGWVAGQQVKGTQEIEEMLVDGTLLTAVGELVVAKDGSIHLRSPNSDRALPFILSTLPYNALLNTYETLVAVCKWSLVFFGGVGVVLCCVMIRKWLRIRYGRRHAREEDEILRDLQESRVDSEENDDLPDWQRCVVCLVRNREVIVLPCGHVCLCADCMLLINQRQLLQRKCPMCRQQIDQIARAFVP